MHEVTKHGSIFFFFVLFLVDIWHAALRVTSQPHQTTSKTTTASRDITCETSALH